MSKYSNYYVTQGSKRIPKYVLFFVDELMKRVMAMGKTTTTYVATIKTQDPEHEYFWDGIELVNKTLLYYDIVGLQTNYSNVHLPDGKREFTYTWKLTPKKKN